MAYKTVMVDIHVEDALDAGELRSLADEMSGWRDNMDGTPLENTGKFDEVSQAADALEDIAQQVEDACGAITGDERLAEVLQSTITIHEQRNKDKRRGPSRAVRCANACAAIRTAIEVIREAAPEDADDGGDTHSYLDDLEQQLDEAETVDFPGMF